MAITGRAMRRGCGLAAAALVAAAAGGAAAAWAQQGTGPAGSCARPPGLLTADDRAAMGRIFMNRVKDRLGLSDQQAEDLRATLKVMRDDARGDRQALCEARVEMERLMAQQDSDPAALKAVGDRLKVLQARLLDRRLDAHLALRGKLTSDQWAKWVDLRKEMGRRFRGRFRPFAS